MMLPAVGIFAMGLLLMALATPLMLGRVKPNALYGLRTPKSLSNADIWYRANRISGRALFAAGATTSAVALAVLALGQALSLDAAVAISMGVWLCSIIAATAYSLRALAKM